MTGDFSNRRIDLERTPTGNEMEKAWLMGPAVAAGAHWLSASTIQRHSSEKKVEIVEIVEIVPSKVPMP